VAGRALGIATLEMRPACHTGRSGRYPTNMQSVTRMAGQTQRETLASAVAGDEAAFARIVATYDDEMYRVCVAICRDQTVAADAVQSAWAIAWRKLGSLRDPAAVRPWLITVAVNEARKLLRKRSRRSEVEQIGDIPDRHGGADPATGVAMLDLIAALERLKPDDRALLVLRYMAGFDASEIASALEATPDAVRQRLKRLMDRLREELR
jgi:RNA polymerase sigma factor (sigma-70 family)